jgi:hypothetical protein
VGDLEALKAIAALSLATDDIEDLVDKLSTLSVVTLGPVVAYFVLLVSLFWRGVNLTSTALAEDEVVGTE